MSVTVERCLDRCVAELGLDVLRVRPLSDQETRISVAQVVKPDAPKLGAAERPRPVPLSEGVGIDRLAVGAAEDEPALEATRELGQRRPQRRRQVDCPARAPGLRCDELPPPERSLASKAFMNSRTSGSVISSSRICPKNGTMCSLERLRQLSAEDSFIRPRRICTVT